MKKYLHIAITIFALLMLAGMAGGAGRAVAQSGESRAGLLVQFADGSVQTFCIPFTGESITGLDLLLKSGLDVKVEAYGGLGAEVCKIGTSGCDYPGQVCACESFGPGGVYWSYHHVKDGRWRASIVGAGSYKVRDDDVEGWAYTSGKPPALYSFSQLCPAAAPQPTEVPTEPPTQTPVEPTFTAIPHSPTARPRLATPTIASTRKPVLSTPTATALPQPSPTPALPESPTQTLTPIVAATLIPTATSTTSLIATSTGTPTPVPTLTPTLKPTLPIPASDTPTPIRNPQSTIRNSEDTARNVGIIIGGLALGSLVVWGAATAIRRGRNRGPDDVE